MAKKRKSIFDTTTSDNEIKDVALSVQKEALQPAKEVVAPSPKKKRETKERKLMHLYVDNEHHRQAKINATIRGMKLGEYMEWLIDKDRESLNR